MHGIHVSVKQKRGLSLGSPPVVRHNPGRFPQGPRGQAPDPNPRQDQQAMVVQNLVKMGDAGIRRPANVAIPSPLVPARRTKAHAAQDSVAGGLNPVANLNPRRTGPSLWMMGFHHRHPEPAVLRVRHLAKGQGSEIGQGTPQRRIRNGTIQGTGLLASRGSPELPSRSGQGQLQPITQNRKGLASRSQTELASGVDPTPRVHTIPSARALRLSEPAETCRFSHSRLSEQK